MADGTAAAAPLEHSRLPVSVVDDDRRVVYVNQAWLDLMGYALEDVLGRHGDELVDETNLDERWDALHERATERGPVRLRRADGTILTVQCVVVAGVSPGRHVAILTSVDSDRRTLLTARERQVVQLAANGYTSREIAARLEVTASTVDTHLVHAQERLGARNRTHAIALALALHEIGI